MLFLNFLKQAVRTDYLHYIFLNMYSSRTIQTAPFTNPFIHQYFGHQKLSQLPQPLLNEVQAYR